MNHFLLFPLFFCCLTLTINAQDPEEETTYEKELQIAQPECLMLMGQSKGFGSRFELKFYNACHESVSANFCVEERPGRYKLHKSAGKIPRFGYLSIFTYEGRAPVSVQWLSSYGSPNIPGFCQKTS